MKKGIDIFILVFLLVSATNITHAQNKDKDKKGGGLLKGKSNGMIYAGLTSGYNFGDQFETVLNFNYIHQIGKNFDLKEGIKNILNNEKPKRKAFSRYIFEIGPCLGYNYDNQFTLGANLKLVFLKSPIGTLRGHVDYLNALTPKVQYLRYGMEYQIPRVLNLKKRRHHFTINYFRTGILSGTDARINKGFLGAGLRLYLRDPRKFYH